MQQESVSGVSNFRPFQGRAAPPASAARFSAAREPSNSAQTEAEPANILMRLTPQARTQLIAERGVEMLLTFRDVYTDPQANEVANELYRDAVRHKVEDADVAERLLPKTYGIGCKRQVLDRDFYDTFNRDDVALVDVLETPIETITATGVMTTQTHYDLDVLVYATGFDAMTGALLKANIRGRDGRTLNDKWEDGPVAYLGLQMHGFPNLFTVTGPGSPSVLCNMLVAIEQHVNWIGECIEHMNKNNLQTIEPTTEAEQGWVAHVNDVAEGTMYTAPSCNSWYLGANIPGKPRIFMPYVGGYPQYRERCEQVVANGYEGFVLDFRTAKSQPR
jgi:cyclohexanone monooxygenase